MSEISLRDYFAKLEQLLTATAADEVIHHCRHILQYYPKNVTAYRFLGRALLINGRWDEANAALRRVLSVVPDDYQAHLGLSEIYDHKNKPDDAIWHLERAFEHNPNSRELLEGIRSLYRRYRDIEQVKVQLTAAAVARQAQRNRAYEQAIETLRDALIRQPERVDLQVLLAQNLWESGDTVEAAETSLDVLQSLPDCLEANKILTLLWLQEDRPSDAQRYLNRVEAIDPYLAVQLAQGQPAPDDAFRLEELEYKQSSGSILTENRPSWLEGITAESSPEASQAGEGDWSNFMSSMLTGAAAAPEESVETPDDSLFGDDWMKEYATPSDTAVDEDEIPPEFAPLFPESSLDDATLITPSASNAPFAPDTMSWLAESGIELQDEQTLDDELVQHESDSLAWMQDDDVQVSARHQGEDAFSWMKEFDVEMVDEPNASAVPSLFDDLPEEETETDTAPAWSQSEGFLEEALGLEKLTQPETNDDLDWLNQPADFDNIFGTDDSYDQAAAEPESPATSLEIPDLFGDVEEEPVSSLADDATSVVEVPTFEEPPDAQGVPGGRRGLTAMLNEANFDWMKEQESQDDIMSDEVMDEWLAHFGATPAKTPAATQEPAWLNELDTVMNEQDKQQNSDETPDWLSGDVNSEEPEAASETSTGEDALDWLNNTASEAEEAGVEAIPADLPTWMTELEPTTPQSPPTEIREESAASEEFEWSDSEFEDTPLEPASVPDWLTQLEPTSTYEVPSSFMSSEDEPEESEFDWLAEEASEAETPQAEAGAYSWLDEAEIEAEAEDAAIEDAVPASENTDWLSGLNIKNQQPAQDDPTGTEAADYTWFDEMLIEAESDENELELEASPAAETEDWLTELHIETPPAASQPAPQSSDFSWLDESEAEEVAAEEPISAELPDWLSEIEVAETSETANEPEPVSMVSDDYTWLGELNAEEENTDEELIAAEADNADWLAELKPETEAEVLVATDDADWLEELETITPVAEEPVTLISERPSGLENFTVPAETPAEPVTADSSEFSWLDEIEPEAEPAAVQEADSSWLDELPSPVSAGLDDEPVTLIADDTDWLSELKDEPQSEAELEAEVVASADLAWLNELEGEISDEIEDEPEAEPLVEAAAETDTSVEPTWLSDLGEEEAEPAVEANWLDEIMTEPEAEPELAAAVTDQPDWLQGLNVETVSETDDEAVSDEFEESFEETLDNEVVDPDAIPSYLLGIQTAEDEEEEDWLNTNDQQIASISSEQSWDNDINEIEDATLATNELDIEDEELYEPAPASNAPDWLNAMVPGLDVDYEASEDEPIETEFVDETSAETPAEEREFDWVEEIVDEESRQQEAVAAETSRPRFVFSRLPAWLKKPAQPTKHDDELPDWPSDEPEWRR